MAHVVAAGTPQADGLSRFTVRPRPEIIGVRRMSRPHFRTPVGWRSTLSHAFARAIHIFPWKMWTKCCSRCLAQFAIHIFVFEIWTAGRFARAIHFFRRAPAGRSTLSFPVDGQEKMFAAVGRAIPSFACQPCVRVSLPVPLARFFGVRSG
jgi:hypothetical protein